MKTEYHKIQSIFKRDPATRHKNFLMGQYTCPEFEFLKDNNWVFTEKVDGTNIRIIFDGEHTRFGGRTDRASIPTFLVNHLNETFFTQQELFRDRFSDLSEGVNVVFYGEGYGPKIQKGGGNYREDVSFVLFDVRIGSFWLKREDVVNIAETFGIDVVPIIGTGTLADGIRMCQEGFNSQWGSFIAEGIVARPLVELKARNGDRVITKIKYKDFQ